MNTAEQKIVEGLENFADALKSLPPQDPRYGDSEMVRQVKFFMATQEFDDAIERMHRAELERSKRRLLAKYGVRSAVFVILCLALATSASSQPQPLPPGSSYYQPAVVYVPKWHSGPLRILWWRSWDAYQQPIPQQFQPQQRGPVYQQPAPLQQPAPGGQQ